MTWREDERRAVIAAAQRLEALGLTQGTSGNVSQRVSGGMAITPTGMPYADLVPRDIVLMALDGTVAAGEGRVPSSEWRMHAAVYQTRPEVAAVVHAHPPASTALACLGRDMPAFHYMIAVAGGDSIRCAPYHLFGTQALAGAAVQALTDRTACLLANHGLLAIGPALDQALEVAREVEFLAGIYLRLLPVGGVKILTAGQMKEVIERFRHYGQRS